MIIFFVIAGFALIAIGFVLFRKKNNFSEEDGPVSPHVRRMLDSNRDFVRESRCMQLRDTPAASAKILERLQNKAFV